MIKKLKINNLIDTLLVIFLFIQPIFDLKIFYNSISTLIRVIIILMLFGYYFFTNKNNKKYWFVLYPIAIGIYFILHHLNALQFKSLVPGNFNYSIIKEALYFLKMISPFLLIYCIYKSSVTNDKLIDIMKILVLIICLIIVISNVFVFSYGNYSNTIIKANFLEWFNPNSPYTYQDLASKGLFEFGNQIAAILIMCLPFMVYTIYKKSSLINHFIIILNIAGLILLCTRVSVFGVLVVFIYTFFTFVFIALINKKQLPFNRFVPLVIILAVYCLLLPLNPTFNRTQEREQTIETFRETVAQELPQDFTQEPSSSIQEVSNEKITYIEENYERAKLPKQFLFENYPYKYDSDFWYDFLHSDISLLTNYRYIELSMIKRVVEINSNPMDKWFGITNTRLQNIFNIEKDFVVQYYALGIIGTILVFAPYFVLLVAFALQTLKLKFKNLTIINLLAFITIIFLFGISYMSGNMLNSLSFSIYFTLCFGLLAKKD